MCGIWKYLFNGEIVSLRKTQMENECQSILMIIFIIFLFK